MLVTFSEFAAIRGCSKAAVTHATKARIADAVVEQDGRRWLDRDLALELWNKNTMATHNAKISRPDPTTPPATAAELRKRVQALPDDQIPDLNESRAKREHYQAELAKLQCQQQRGELVEAEEVRREAFKLGRTIRDSLMALPDRLAAQLAGTSDTRLCHILLSQELTTALRVLADG